MKKKIPTFVMILLAVLVTTTTIQAMKVVDIIEGYQVDIWFDLPQTLRLREGEFVDITIDDYMAYHDQNFCYIRQLGRDSYYLPEGVSFLLRNTKTKYSQYGASWSMRYNTSNSQEGELIKIEFGKIKYDEKMVEYKVEHGFNHSFRAISDENCTYYPISSSSNTPIEQSHSAALAPPPATTTAASVKPKIDVTIFPVAASSAGESRQVSENRPPLIGSEGDFLPFKNCRMPYKWAPSFKPKISTTLPSISATGKTSGVLFRLPIIHLKKGDTLSMRGNIKEGKIEFGLTPPDERAWMAVNTLGVGDFDSTVIAPFEGDFLPLFLNDKNLNIDVTITDISIP